MSPPTLFGLVKIVKTEEEGSNLNLAVHLLNDMGKCVP